MWLTLLGAAAYTLVMRHRDDDVDPWMCDPPGDYPGFCFSPNDQWREEDMDTAEDELADWRLIVIRHLILAGVMQATDAELEPYWTAGLSPLAAAARLLDDRNRQDPQGESA